MKRHLTIGTRGSRLAIIQTELVADALKKLEPDLTIEIKTITTRGDADKTTPIPLDTVGKAWFTEEIEQALQNGEIDMAVHSLKDVPPEVPPGLIHLAVLERADPRDVLISKTGAGLAELPPGAVVGTDSLRRKALLLHRRPDLKVISIRGNVDTRLQKVQNDGPYDAIVLAAAGIMRLGRQADITEYLPTDWFVPAIGQGVLAAEIAADDTELMSLLTATQHAPTLAAVSAEQAFASVLGAGCKLPVGCYAEIKDGRATLHAVAGATDGLHAQLKSARGAATEAITLAENLARSLADATPQA